MGERPLLGASALIVDDGRVLLVLRKRDPFAGRWSLPGGKVGHGEKLHAALKREMVEETGLRIKVGGLVTIHEQIGPGDIHAAIVVFAATVTGGRLAASDDAADAAWIPLDEVAKLRTTPDLKSVLKLA